MPEEQKHKHKWKNVATGIGTGVHFAGFRCECGASKTHTNGFTVVKDKKGRIV